MRKETLRDVPTRLPKRKEKRGEPTESAEERDRLETLLAFETLISQLSGTFVNLSSDQVDRAIESWLGRVAELLGMELATVAQFSQDMSDVRFTHGWAAHGLEPPSNVHTVDRWPWGLDQIRRGNIVQFTNVEELPEEANIDKLSFREVGSISHISIPLTVAEKIIGVLSFGARHVVDEWPEDFIKRFRVIGDVFSNALMRKRYDEDLIRAFSEIKALKEQLEAENAYLNEQIRLKEHHSEIVGESTAIKTVLSQIEQVAGTDSTVLIRGETGTGKELVANAIHRLSKRSNCSFVKVNCAAIPTTLIESELFGREKGAFTGALSKQVGRFEMAHKGTILLDEISELPIEVQGKLLRVLEKGEGGAGWTYGYLVVRSQSGIQSTHSIFPCLEGCVDLSRTLMKRTA
jgi:formate hydrogenlyase transcriptional activator